MSTYTDWADVPKNAVRYALDYQADVWVTVRQYNGVWLARGRKTTRHKMREARSRTEREAMQKLCDEMGLMLP